jgi:uncharacterized protein YjiS (DUF1127 family)
MTRNSTKIITGLPTTTKAPALPFLRRVALWATVWRHRRQLAEMTETQLNDMGLTRAQADDEAALPFWDVPAHWRQ